MASRASSSSCSCHYAQAFSGIRKEELEQKIKDVLKSLQLRNQMYSRMRWKVFMLSKGYFTHYSLLFTPGNNKGFVIHFIVRNNEIKFLLEEMEDINSKISKYKLTPTELGTTEPIDAWTIVVEAHNILVGMGSFHEAFNNCQNYCVTVAKKIGVSPPVTGSDVAVAGLAVTIVGGIIGTVIYKFCSGNSKDDKKK